MKPFFVLLVLFLLSSCTSQNPALQGFENAPGQTLLAEGLQRHESGKFDEAVVFFDAAYQKFAKDDNKDKMAETLSAKSLTLRRLNRLDEAITDLGKAVQITDGTGGVVLPLYNLAKTQEAAGKPESVQTYQRALDAMETYRPPHYRPADVNDMKIHLAVAELHFKKDVKGDAEQRILVAVDALIKDDQLDGFAKMVWTSGGYMGLARYYISSDAEKAWGYFDQAEKIINSYTGNKALRLQDIEALRAEMPKRP